jgi:hypothetical protein
MTAYVESNFVLELALQQEEFDACTAIVELASQGRLVLMVPAFSHAEPHVAIAGKEKARNQLRRDLDAQVRDLARSKPHHTVRTDFAAFVGVWRTAPNSREMVFGILFQTSCNVPKSLHWTL